MSSCYTLVWDLKMDWGLFDRNAGENTFLREEIVYPHKVLHHTEKLQLLLWPRYKSKSVSKCPGLQAELSRLAAANPLIHKSKQQHMLLCSHTA